MLKPTGTVPKPPPPPDPTGPLKIDDGVPIPARGSRHNPHAVALREALPRMKPGQSVRAYVSAASAQKIPKDLGIKVARRVEKDELGRPCYRVWRLK